MKQDFRKYRQPLSRKCSNGDHTCSRADDDLLCGVYLFPDAKWRLGDCPMADSELRTAEDGVKAGGKKRVGQQKQKKKGLR
jgi:hypothetical protein